ncbi:MAG TPA: sigma-70 family RNA polymerase sigma factor [Verrucomicrobiae bacterium]
MRPDQASAETPRWETIEELFTALEAPLLSYGLRLTGEIGLAEDVVQEAFMKLHLQFKEVREPRRWLYRTVHNLALNQRRRTAKIVSFNSSSSVGNENSPVTADTADPAPLPDEQISRMEGIGLVRLSLGTLDDRSRELIRLKFNDELSYRDISARTGISISNVGYILHNALKTIGDELARTGVVP